MNTQISDWPLGARVASFSEEPKPLEKAEERVDCNEHTRYRSRHRFG
jgi:hypothetical protein